MSVFSTSSFFSAAKDALSNLERNSSFIKVNTIIQESVAKHLLLRRKNISTSTCNFTYSKLLVLTDHHLRFIGKSIVLVLIVLFSW